MHKKTSSGISKKLNIAMVCDPVTDYIAGSYVSTLSFAEILKERGHKVVFLAARSPISPKNNFWKGIKVYRFYSLLLPKSEHKVYLGFEWVKKIKKILQDEKIDIVHVMIPTPLSILAIKAAKSLGIKVVAHSHTQAENLSLYWPKLLLRDLLNRLFYKYFAWIYKQSDFLIHPSEFSKNIFSKLKVKTKSVVISNGVDIKRFKKVDTKKFSGKYKLPSDAKIILFVGRLHPEKKVDTLIKAMPIILQEEPKSHVCIVGSGNMDKPLEKLVKKLGMEQHITFLGKLDDKELVLAHNVADVFVLPSICELEGMAVLEAMSCGKPIVVADAKDSAAKYFVTNNGYLFEPQSSKDLAEKTVKILADDRLRRKMGEASFERSRDFDIQKSITKLEETYYSLLNN